MGARQGARSKPRRHDALRRPHGLSPTPQRAGVCFGSLQGVRLGRFLLEVDWRIARSAVTDRRSIMDRPAADHGAAERGTRRAPTHKCPRLTPGIPWPVRHHPHALFGGPQRRQPADPLQRRLSVRAAPSSSEAKRRLRLAGARGRVPVHPAQVAQLLGDVEMAMSTSMFSAYVVHNMFVPLAF